MPGNRFESKSWYRDMSTASVTAWRRDSRPGVENDVLSIPCCAQWNDIAPDYTWSPFEFQHVMKPFLEQVGNLQGKRVIEFGCGIGVVTVELAKSALEVEAIDASEEMLSHAYFACRQHSNISFLKEWFERKLTFPKLFDLAVFAFSLEQQHSRDEIAQALRNAKAAVKWRDGQGAICVLLPHPCFDFNQTGDIQRRMDGHYVERPDIEIQLTPAHGRSVIFAQPHWRLEDYFDAADRAGLFIYALKEIGVNHSVDQKLEPRYMSFKCRPTENK